MDRSGWLRMMLDPISGKIMLAYRLRAFCEDSLTDSLPSRYRLKNYPSPSFRSGTGKAR